MDTRTPQEIEEGITSTPTVTWDPFTVLPKEIYLEIFKKLDNATDKQNFMNAHKKWFDLFKGERVRFLFEKVIDVLDLPSEEEFSTHLSFRETDRHLTRLRLVCRDWDRGIQNYYQLHPDHFQLVCEDAWKTNSKHLKEQYRSGYVMQARGLLEWRSGVRTLQSDWTQFVASHPPSKNPFLTRKISVNFYNSNRMDNEEARGVLWSRVDTLLETYGQHIWHFSFKDGAGSKLTPEIYLMITHWLQLMPELKTLQISFHRDWHNRGKHEANSLTNIIQIEPPEMRKLKTLHVSNVPTFAFNKLLEGMKALEKFEVSNKKPDVYLRLKGYQLPTNLAEAALTLTGTEDFEHLSTLDQLPQLRKLIINLEYECFRNLPSRGVWTEWKTIWDTIAEKFPAVEDLHLTLPRGSHTNKRKAMEQSLDHRLNLTTLKRLSVILPNLSSLDFLQDMKGLQELKVQLDHSKRDEFKGSDDLIQSEAVQFNNRGLDTMWESNIWELFPNLRKLRIRAYAGFRGKQRVIKVHSYEKKGRQERLYKKY